MTSWVPNRLILLCILFVKHDGEHGQSFPNVGYYRCLVGKLIYLIVTRLDIAYVVSQFMNALAILSSTQYVVIYIILRVPQAAVYSIALLLPCLSLGLVPPIGLTVILIVVLLLAILPLLVR